MKCAENGDDEECRCRCPGLGRPDRSGRDESAEEGDADETPHDQAF